LTRFVEQKTKHHNFSFTRLLNGIGKRIFINLDLKYRNYQTWFFLGIKKVKINFVLENNFFGMAGNKYGFQAAQTIDIHRRQSNTFLFSCGKTTVFVKNITDPSPDI